MKLKQKAKIIEIVKIIIWIVFIEFIVRRIIGLIVSIAPVIMEIFENLMASSTSNSITMIWQDFLISGKLLFMFISILLVMLLNFFLDWKDFNEIKSKGLKVVIVTMMAFIVLFIFYGSLLYAIIVVKGKTQWSPELIRIFTYSFVVIAWTLSGIVSSCFKIDKKINENGDIRNV